MSVIVSREVILGNLPAVLGDMANGVRAITFEKALKESSVYLSSKGKESFDKAQTPDGAAWRPLKRQRRRKRDRKRGKKADGSPQGGQKPLRDTGLLMASISARTARGAIREIGPTHLEQGTNLHYAAYHQLGTRHIPKREFLGITDPMMDRIMLFIADDIVRQLVG